MSIVFFTLSLLAFLSLFFFWQFIGRMFVYLSKLFLVKRSTWSIHRAWRRNLRRQYRNRDGSFGF